MTTRDMEYIRMETPYVTGLPESMGGAGNPSPFTAYGVYMGMKAAAKKAYGSDSLEGKKILVQGTGQVGSNLIDLISKEKALISVSDIFEDKTKLIAKQYKAEVVRPQDIFDSPMHIYAPCALGGTINDESIEKMSCDIIAGAANNQLLKEEIHDRELVTKGILYAPDFLINGGGITNVYYEYEGNYNKDRVMAQTERIYETTLNVFDLCDKKKTSPQIAAIELAQQRIDAIGKIRLTL